MSISISDIEKIKRQAKKDAKSMGIKLSMALESIAKKKGFSNWHDLISTHKKPPTPNDLLNYRDALAFAINNKSVAYDFAFTLNSQGQLGASILGIEYSEPEEDGDHLYRYVFCEGVFIDEEFCNGDVYYSYDENDLEGLVDFKNKKFYPIPHLQPETIYPQDEYLLTSFLKLIIPPEQSPLECYDPIFEYLRDFPYQGNSESPDQIKSYINQFWRIIVGNDFPWRNAQ